MIKTHTEINNILKEKLEKVIFMEPNPDTYKFIETEFITLSEQLEPQNLEIDSIEFIKPELKIEYQIDDKQYTMIVDCKRK